MLGHKNVSSKTLPLLTAASGNPSFGSRMCILNICPVHGEIYFCGALNLT